MFSANENRFLQTEMKRFVERGKERLDSPELGPLQREKLEEKLFLTISILGKLERRAEKEEAARARRQRVLIVDDVGSMRQVNRQFFQQLGFSDVDMAEEGVRALAMMRSAVENDKPYTLVISDWEMPKMTGLELLRQVRLDENLWRTHFYLLTSVSDKKHITEAINTGASGYMVKPINLNMLRGKFGSWVAAQ
jgi:two-component system chemotaxis response regulator CheY